MPVRWHQFHNAHADPVFGQGTDRQARRWVMTRNAHPAANRYEMTTLDGTDPLPPDGAIVVDLDTGDFLPERHRRKPDQP